LTNPTLSVAVFDLGGVLIDWDPRHLYRKLFREDEAAMEEFLSRVCTPEWNRKQDAGRSFAEGCAILAAEFPDKADLIYAWYRRFDETLRGPVKESINILANLLERNIALYSITNWNRETFAASRKRFPFLDWFSGIVVSGEEKVAKPDPRIYRILMDRYSLDPAGAVFVDDSPENVEAAEKLGFTGIVFSSPEDLRRRLKSLNLL